VIERVREGKVGQTPREIAEERKGKRATALARELLLVDRWRLAPTLLWIGLRDMARVAAPMPDLESAFADLRAGSQVSYVSTYLESQDDVFQPEPASAHLNALQRGAAKAFGRPNGLGYALPIGPEQWDGLAFLDGPNDIIGVECAIRRNWNNGEALGDYWSDICFDRESLFVAFPPRLEVLDPDSDERVDATIRELIRERGGVLPQNEGATIVRAKHSTRRRDEVRERIKALTGNLRPGPTGPRANRAGNRANLT
jgi:hypothetical protein